MYREEIMDHYKRPRNTGKLDTRFKAEGENASCGDTAEIFVLVDDGVVSEVRHESDACAICTAATSILSEKVIGFDLERVEDLDRDWMIDELGVDVSPMRVKCAVLGLETLQDALDQ